MTKDIEDVIADYFFYYRNDDTRTSQQAALLLVKELREQGFLPPEGGQTIAVESTPLERKYEALATQVEYLAARVDGEQNVNVSQDEELVTLKITTDNLSVFQVNALARIQQLETKLPGHTHLGNAYGTSKAVFND